MTIGGDNRLEKQYVLGELNIIFLISDIINNRLSYLYM